MVFLFPQISQIQGENENIITALFNVKKYI
jgi:hypothetical protein